MNAAATVLAALVIAAVACPSGDLLAGDAHGGHGAGARGGELQGRAAPPRGLPRDEGEQRRYFTDLPLVTQEGKAIRFYTDVLKDRVVLVGFIYTNCTEVCPILMRNLRAVEELLGDRAREVRIVAISVDPEEDTPEALARYAERWGAGPGWIFLTGKKKNVDWIVYKLGQYTPDFENHSMLFLLGDVRNGRWRKIRGDAPPEAVAAMLRDLLAGG